MRSYFLKILATFGYKSVTEFIQSLFPSLKYQHLTLIVAAFSSLSSMIDLIFGMTGLAFVGFLLIMLIELVSGIKASQIRGEAFSSVKLSRFSFKMFYYLVIIGSTYLLSMSYQAHGRDLVAEAFIWLHMFLVIQIVMENIVSILENISIIDGKDKTYWVKKIQDKINSML